MSKSSARAGSPIAEPAEWFDAVVDARYGKGVRDEILEDAERAFRTHFDDAKSESDWTCVDPGYSGTVAGVAVRLVGRPSGTLILVR